MPESEKTILLVEDHPPNVLVATMFFEQLGYLYEVAATGPEALEKFISLPRFALVILDLQLPEIDGYEVAKRIRAHEKAHNLPPTPILAVTGNGTEEDRFLCLRGGMDDYLSKPYRLPDLEKKLAALTGIAPIQKQA